SIAQFSERFPDSPLVVVLTGTDLYRDIRTDGDAQASLALADRLVVLQDMGRFELPARFRGKTRVIYQSAEVHASREPPSSRVRIAGLGERRHAGSRLPRLLPARRRAFARAPDTPRGPRTRLLRAPGAPHGGPPAAVSPRRGAGRTAKAARRART